MSSANGLLPIGCTCLIVRATVWHVCRDGHVSSRTGSCVSVFTHGNNGVCKVGHMSGEMGLSVSDCAHGLCACVQSRTHEWRDGLVFVRLCTRSVSVCAKLDTKTVKLGSACPYLHTATMACVQSRTHMRCICIPENKKRVARRLALVNRRATPCVSPSYSGRARLGRDA